MMQRTTRFRLIALGFAPRLAFEDGFEGRFIVDNLRPGLQSTSRIRSLQRGGVNVWWALQLHRQYLASPTPAQSLCPSKEIGHII